MWVLFFILIFFWPQHFEVSYLFTQNLHTSSVCTGVFSRYSGVNGKASTLFWVGGKILFFFFFLLISVWIGSSVGADGVVVCSVLFLARSWIFHSLGIRHYVYWEYMCTDVGGIFTSDHISCVFPSRLYTAPWEVSFFVRKTSHLRKACLCEPKPGWLRSCRTRDPFSLYLNILCVESRWKQTPFAEERVCSTNGKKK